MMRENRLLFEVTDLTHVRLICTTCNGTMLCGLDNNLPPPAQCPACGKSWWTDPPGENIAEVALLKALRALRTAHEWRSNGQTNAPNVKLQLEFLDDKS